MSRTTMNLFGKGVKIVKDRLVKDIFGYRLLLRYLTVYCLFCQVEMWTGVVTE